LNNITKTFENQKNLANLLAELLSKNFSIWRLN
jgi:hypothetical protein